MSAEAKSDLSFELDRLERLVQNLNQTLKVAEPTDIYASHLGHMNHSFYNGFEKCLLFILTIKGVSRPSDSHWHRSLLDLFQGDMAGDWVAIEELRGFRHIFRHTYYYDLEYEKVREVSDRIAPLWQQLSPWLATFLHE